MEAENNQIDLDTPLISFFKGNDAGGTDFTIRDSFNGLFIAGNVGSGKTSGSGRAIALKMLRQGFAGLVLTAKADEAEAWKGYCELADRSQDLLLVEPKGSHFFNFLEYESTRNSELTYTENIFQILKTVIQASEQRTSGKSDDHFWENALDQFMTNTISLCLLAYNKVTVDLLYDIAQSAPRKEQPIKSDDEPSGFEIAHNLAKENVRKLTEVWASQQDSEEIAALSQREYEFCLSNEIPETRNLKLIKQFFFNGLFSIGEKTRSIIDFCFTGFLFRLLQDPMYGLFCQHKSTFTPDDCLGGKIIVINLPVKLYHKAGQDAQIMMKYVWQRAMERRNVDENGRPVFLFADESHLFLHEKDAEFQATARSSRIATVYITQNLPQYHTNMGGAKSEHRVKGFIATFGTKLFHCNNDLETNRWASELIGKAYSEDISTGSQFGKDISISDGSRYTLEDMVRPEYFARLKTGGPLNDYMVEAYILMQGKKFPSGFAHCKIVFNQKSN